MSKTTVIMLIFISILLSACSSKPPDNIVIIPSTCKVVAGEQIGFSVSGTFSNDTVIEWEATSGVISPNKGYAVIFTAPPEAGKATITAIVVTKDTRTPNTLECQISPVPITELPPETQTPIPAATETPMPTSTLPPAPACDLLSVKDFKLISPPGLHGAQTIGGNIPKLTTHAPVTWEPSYCPLTIEVYLGGVLVREYKSYTSGMVDTAFIMEHPEFRDTKFTLKSGDWIEIKIWVEGKTPPSDNVHLLLP